jgi:tRNA-dihydrouridine synthase
MEDITPEELNRILIYEPPMEIKNEIIDKSAQYLKILWKCRKSYNEITSFFEEYCSGFINEKQFKNELKNIKNEINSILLID